MWMRVAPLVRGMFGLISPMTILALSTAATVVAAVVPRVTKPQRSGLETCNRALSTLILPSRIMRGTRER